MNRFSSLFLAIALLLAQSALLGHEYDFAAHKSGDTCVICLHATPLSHAMVGAVFLAFPLPVQNTAFRPLVLQASTGCISAYLARAPPVVASV